MLRRFWAWYQQHYAITLLVTAAIFLLQIFHLYWLFTDVILKEITGRSFFVFPEGGFFIYVVADYLEIPALFSTSLLYLYDLRRGMTVRSIVYLLLLNSQWAHILWITDEIVISTFADHGFIAWNAWVAWVAILIDYLEVPVIVDTLRKVWAEREEIWGRIGGAIGRTAMPATATSGSITMMPVGNGRGPRAATDDGIRGSNENDRRGPNDNPRPTSRLSASGRQSRRRRSADNRRH